VDAKAKPWHDDPVFGVEIELIDANSWMVRLRVP